MVGTLDEARARRPRRRPGRPRHEAAHRHARWPSSSTSRPSAAVRAEDDSGSFGILPGHADFLTALAALGRQLDRRARDGGATAPCAAASDRRRQDRRRQSPPARRSSATISTTLRADGAGAIPKPNAETQRDGARGGDAAAARGDPPDHAPPAARRRCRGRTLVVSARGDERHDPAPPDGEDHWRKTGCRCASERHRRWRAGGRAVGRPAAGARSACWAGSSSCRCWSGSSSAGGSTGTSAPAILSGAAADARAGARLLVRLEMDAGAMIALCSHPRLAGAGGLAGFSPPASLLGFVHFGALLAPRAANSSRARGWWRTVGLAAARFALLLGALTLASLQGAPALLAVTLGLLGGRALVMRRVGRTPDELAARHRGLFHAGRCRSASPCSSPGS